MKKEKNPIQEAFEKLFVKLPLCRKFETCHIAYNHNLSGDCVIIPKKGEPIKIDMGDILKFYCECNTGYKSILMGDNIISHILMKQGMKEEIKKYFRCDSELWKAIVSHIKDIKNCVIIEHKNIDENYYIEDVSIKNVYIYGSASLKDGEKLYISFDIETEFCDCESYDYNNATHRERYLFDAPSDLEINYSKVAFNNWIEELRNIRDYRRSLVDNQELERLIKKYPENAKTIIKKI